MFLLSPTTNCDLVAVVKHFDDFHEDQFDFHSYCIRKVTLRAYVDVLRFEDRINGHEFYLKAAEGIVKVYLYLFDNPTSANGVADEPDYSTMTAAERKKAKAAARRKKKNTEKEAAVVATAAQQSSKLEGNDGNNTSPVVVDEDPNGEVLLKRDPMEEAKKYTNVLVNNAPKSLMTWILQYDVSIRRNKLLMALQVRDTATLFKITVSLKEECQILNSLCFLPSGFVQS
jgi:peptide alpha-N-acetyltransferase